ncbi:MAG: sulfotransferase domain-containing protein [Elainellaceae cyanobacterium]
MLDISTETNVPYYSINKPEFQDTINNSSWKKFIESKPGHGYFGPIRSREAMPIFPEKINEYSVILHLRDPRDVLVSLFFSYTYSHTRGKGFNVQEVQRQQWQQDGIDLFVVEYLDNFKERYLLLIDKLLLLNNVTLLKYEDMVTDYAKWLESFLDSCLCKHDSYIDDRTSDLLKSDSKNTLHKHLVENIRMNFLE